MGGFHNFKKKKKNPTGNKEIGLVEITSTPGRFSLTLHALTCMLMKSGSAVVTFSPETSFSNTFNPNLSCLGFRILLFRFCF